MQDPGDLVEALAGRVVQGVPEVDDGVAGQVAHQQQRGVPAGDDEHDARVRQRTAVERRGGHVPGEVVHPVQRDAEREGVRLGGRHPDLQRPGQARTGRHRHRADVGQGEPGPPQGLVDHRRHRLEVRAGGDLGDHAAVAGVLVHRGRHRLAEQHAVAHQPRAGLVAGRLDAQHHRRSGHSVHPYCLRLLPATIVQQGSAVKISGVGGIRRSRCLVSATDTQ